MNVFLQVNHCHDSLSHYSALFNWNSYVELVRSNTNFVSLTRKGKAINAEGMLE